MIIEVEVKSRSPLEYGSEGKLSSLFSFIGALLLKEFIEGFRR